MLITGAVPFINHIDKLQKQDEIKAEYGNKVKIIIKDCMIYYTHHHKNNNKNVFTI